MTLESRKTRELPIICCKKSTISKESNRQPAMLAANQEQSPLEERKSARCPLVAEKNVSIQKNDNDNMQS